jgi:hypothetical protein
MRRLVGGAMRRRPLTSATGRNARLVDSKIGLIVSGPVTRRYLPSESDNPKTQTTLTRTKQLCFSPAGG